MTPPPDLSRLTETEKDALILALWAQVQALTARVAHLEARLNEPTEDAGQLQPAAVQGPQGEPAGEGAARRAACRASGEDRGPDQAAVKPRSPWRPDPAHRSRPSSSHRRGPHRLAITHIFPCWINGLLAILEIVFFRAEPFERSHVV